MTALEGQSLPRSRARAQGLAGHWATMAAWGQGHHHGHSWAKVLTLPQHSVDAALKRRKRKGSCTQPLGLLVRWLQGWDGPPRDGREGREAPGPAWHPPRASGAVQGQGSATPQAGLMRPGARGLGLPTRASQPAGSRSSPNCVLSVWRPPPPATGITEGHHAQCSGSTLHRTGLSQVPGGCSPSLQRRSPRASQNRAWGCPTPSPSPWPS